MRGHPSDVGWQSLVAVALCTLQQSKILKLLNLHASNFVSSFQYVTICTPYRKLRQIFPDKNLLLITRKFITALTYDATKQNVSNNFGYAIFMLARLENSQLFKMRDSTIFSVFISFIRRLFFSLKNICDKIDFHVARHTC